MGTASCGYKPTRYFWELQPTTVMFLSRALTTRAQPITQRAAPFPSHPRTLSTCSSSESQLGTTLRRAPQLIGWLGIRSSDTSFVNSVHLKRWLRTCELSLWEDVGRGDRCSCRLGVSEYGLLVRTGMGKWKYCPQAVFLTICRQDCKGRDSVSSVKMEFSCSLRLLGSSLGMWKRRAELEFKIEHSVYNVKICFLKKEKRMTYAKSLRFSFDGVGGCFKKAKEAPPILNPRGHRALSSKYHTILYLGKYAAPSHKVHCPAGSVCFSWFFLPEKWFR